MMEWLQEHVNKKKFKDLLKKKNLKVASKDNHNSNNCHFWVPPTDRQFLYHTVEKPCQVLINVYKRVLSTTEVLCAQLG